MSRLFEAFLYFFRMPVFILSKSIKSNTSCVCLCLFLYCCGNGFFYGRSCQHLMHHKYSEYVFYLVVCFWSQMHPYFCPVKFRSTQSFCLWQLLLLASFFLVAVNAYSRWPYIARVWVARANRPHIGHTRYYSEITTT